MTKPATSAVRECGACRVRVIQAFTATGRAVLLNHPPTKTGAVAAHLDPESGVWRARFLRHGEDHDPETETRFRQHSVTCDSTTTDSVPLVFPPDVTDTTITGPPTAVLEPLPALSRKGGDAA